MTAAFPVTINAGDISARINGFGRMESFVVAGAERSADCRGTEPVGAPDWYWGSFPLAPWVGQNPGLPPLGLVYDRPWRLDAADATSLSMSIALTPEPHWPHDAVVTQQFVAATDSLACRLSVETRSEPFAANLGLHPWWRKEAARHFSPGARLALTGEGMTRARTADLGDHPWDELFVELESAPRLAYPDGVTVTLQSDAPVWVVYEHHTGDYCVEPWTGTDGPLPAEPNVFPGRPLVLELGLVVSRDSGQPGHSA